MALEQYLRERLARKDLLLMTHVVCGYPSFEDNWAELEVMAEFDVDVVELQFPFSEPSADGPLFIKANQEAINHGVRPADSMDHRRSSRKRETAIRPRRHRIQP